MRFLCGFLWLIARIVPASSRRRWLEEWRAELAHGRWTMVFGALPDAWALRRLPPKGGSHESFQERPQWLPPLGGRTSSPGLFHAFPQDVRHALRGLMKSPGFTFAAIASLSIGIAANTVAFSVLNALVFRPFPAVHDQDSLVRVMLVRVQGRTGLIDATFDQYAALREAETLSGIAALHETTLAIGRVATPANVPGAIVTANYFDVLGAQPVAGRFFAPEEDREPGSHPAAVVSHRVWQQMFGASASAIGQWITVNGGHVRVVGVAPPHFAGVQEKGLTTDVWITFAMSELALRDAGGNPAHASRVGPMFLDIVGRLTPVATAAQAQAELAVLAADSSRPNAVSSRARLRAIRRDTGPRNAAEMLAFMMVPFIVLAIACVNAANLLLARASRRATEWRVRLALGGTRWRVIRQILTESVVVALLAAGVGLVITYWALQFQQQMITEPLWIDGRILAFTLLIAVTTALVFGIGPAVAATRAGMQRTPAGGSEGIRPGQRRMRAGLIAVQAALALALLISGAQLARTVLLANVFAVPDADRLLVASFDLDTLRYTPGQTREFYERLATDARKLSGARTTVVAGGDLWGPLPFDGQLLTWTPVDPPASPRKVHAVYTAGDLHGVLGLPLASGRRFVAEDHVGQPRSVIVNERFVKDLLPEGALGRTIRIAGGDGRYETGRDVTIVGIVPSAHEPTVRRNEPPTVYYPVPVEHQPALNLFLRFDGEAEAATAGLRALVREIDDRLPFTTLNTAEGLQTTKGKTRRWIARSMAILGLAALVLAASGLFSVVSFIVSQRQREIGIRMTLGADGGSVLRLILRQALAPTAMGCLAGVGIAAGTAQVMRWGAHGAPAIDVVAFGAAALVMLAVMTLASMLPARRATRVDPMTVLRQE
jgi:predicted permease